MSDIKEKIRETFNVSGGYFIPTSDSSAPLAGVYNFGFEIEGSGSGLMRRTVIEVPRDPNQTAIQRVVIDNIHTNQVEQVIDEKPIGKVNLKYPDVSGYSHDVQDFMRKSGAYLVIEPV